MLNIKSTGNFKARSSILSFYFELFYFLDETYFEKGRSFSKIDHLRFNMFRLASGRDVLMKDYNLTELLR